MGLKTQSPRPGRPARTFDEAGSTQVFISKIKAQTQSCSKGRSGPCPIKVKRVGPSQRVVPPIVQRSKAKPAQIVSIIFHNLNPSSIPIPNPLKKLSLADIRGTSIASPQFVVVPPLCTKVKGRMKQTRNI
ncbi:hypothetical protein AKJ16_DCAP25803 [Drosera capensis]